MSCWSLRLPPAKKAWKSFTSKLQSKLLRNLQYNSKAIKKPKTHRLYTTTDIPANPATTGAAISVSPSPFLQQRKRCLLQPPKPNRAFRLRYHSRYNRYPFKKKATPASVYIDRLFKDPVAAAELVAKYPAPIPKNVKQDQARAPGAGGTSNNNINNNEEEKACSSAADEMWESLALASPQMNGIDQRAEDFIQRFRAEMDRQKMMARRL